jgi:transcriptional regulator with XRE-family HTH domain
VSPAERRLRTLLAANVRRLRQKRGLTTEESAERAHLHARHWQKVEAGEVNATLATLSRIADVLDVTVAELLS